jgi:hypothetical protein
MPGDAAFVFRGGLVIVAVLSAIVIAGLRVPGTPLATLLELGVFRWIGRRSYGLYLWHWPVFVLVVSALPSWARDGASGWALGGIALAVTVVAAALSYRFVEQPIRRLGFRAALRRLGRGWPATPARAIATVVAAVLLLGVGTGTVTALASDPGVGETQLAVEAGQQAIRDASRRSEAPPPSPSASPTAPAGGPEISAVGDSVMLATAPALEARLPGISIHAAVSRRLPAALGIVETDLAAGTLHRVVVVGLATNGPIERSTLEQLRGEVGLDRQLIVVNVQAPRGWTSPNNRMLADFAASYRNVELADWHDAAQAVLPDLNRDQVHFGPTGARVYTDSLQAALERLASLPPLPATPSAPRPPPS